MGVALVLALALPPAPAQAHAELTGTTPQAGAVLAEPPDEVLLRFSEPVELAFAAISVFDAAGSRREVGSPRHAAERGRVVAVSLAPLEPGGYAVTWAVTSSDGHPIEGTFTFRVEAAAPQRPPVLTESTPAPGSVLEEGPGELLLTFDREVQSANVRVFDGSGARVAAGTAVADPAFSGRLRMPITADLAPGGYVVGWQVEGAGATAGAFTFRIAGSSEGGVLEQIFVPEGGSTAVGVAQAAARWGLFLSLALLTGGFAFAAWLWPAGLLEPRVLRLMWVALAGGVVATLAGLVIQVPYASGRSFTSALDPEGLRSVLSTRYGEAGALRLAVLAGMGLVLALVGRRPRIRLGLRVAGAVLGFIALATLSLSGHAAAGSLVGFALVSDVVHLSAAAIWVGGLVLVWSSVLNRDLPEQRSVVVRFSRVAFWCVLVIVGTGLFAGWRQAGSVNATLTTTYGRVLLVKVGLFVLLVAVAALSRARVRRRWQSDEDPDSGRSGLRRLVAVETALAVGILGMTALLVGAVPARAAELRPFESELVASAVHRSVEVSIEPARAGLVEVHVYTFDSQTGAVAEVDRLAGRFERAGVGTLQIDLSRAGPGHFSAYDFDVPISGRWALLIEGEVNGQSFEVSTPVDFR